ncbi:MAG: zinc-regulated TonB-dependent outer membrane receptor [Myxococcales bacterium]|nr:zinc-regulated TonB-dependent outer membrane receptor [Myxococcales bacterium]
MRWFWTLLVAAHPAWAQPALTPEEQAALAAAFAEPAAPPAAPAAPSANPDIALILDVAAAWFDGEPAQLGGHDPQETGFTFQQLELTLQHAVDPYLALQANIVFHPEGVEVEEAFATTLALPGGLQARAGRFLNRVGRQNTQHPHAWAFVDQPLVLGALLGGEGSAGVGVEASWLAPLPWYLVLYASVTGAEAGHDHEAAAEAEAEGFEALPTARLEQFFPFNDDWSLSLGASAQLPPAHDGDRGQLYAADAYLRWRPVASTSRLALSWQTEALVRRLPEEGPTHEDRGLYTQLVLDFAERWQVGGRTEWLDEAEGDARRRHSAQVSFFPSHFSRLRLQLGLDERTDDVVPSAFLALETLIGAHGAHGF